VGSRIYVMVTNGEVIFEGKKGASFSISASNMGWAGCGESRDRDHQSHATGPSREPKRLIATLPINCAIKALLVRELGRPTWLSQVDARNWTERFLDYHGQTFPNPIT
jgi:hypothetical protein